MKVFISYASEDLNQFKIPEIATYLENQSEIQNVYYWERDNNSNMTIVEYMEQSILNSDVVSVVSLDTIAAAITINMITLAI